jgi:hypothetical protein
VYIEQKCGYCDNELRGTEVEYFKEVPIGAKDKGITETCIQVTCPYCDKDYGYYEGSIYTHKTLFRRKTIYQAIIGGNASDSKEYYISKGESILRSKLGNIKVASIGNIGKVEVDSWENDY